MPDLQNLTALAAFALVSSITPGPNNLMLMASGSNFGLRPSLPHLAGVCIGFVIMLLALGSGIGLALQAIPAFALVLKVLSAAYLLYLAWRIATAPVMALPDGATQARPFTFLQAAAFQWVNPKAWTMGLTAVAAFVPPDSGIRGAGIMALVFGLINLPSILVWTVAGVQLRRFLDRPGALRLFNISAALLLVASLAFSFWP